MKKLTVKEAIKRHRKQWDWHTKNPEKEKHDYMDEFYPGEEVLNDCWLCEVNKIKNNVTPGIRYYKPVCCVLNWKVTSTCYEVFKGYYALWDNWAPGNLKKKEVREARTMLAEKIRDLKEA